MPVIEIETNVKVRKDTVFKELVEAASNELTVCASTVVFKMQVEDSKALVVKLSKFSSQILGKPEGLILVKYTHNEALCWGGTFDPAFVLAVNSIGTFSPEKNPSIIEEYTKFLKENLGIDDKRGYVVLKDPGKDTTGYSGTTITKLFSK